MLWVCFDNNKVLCLQFQMIIQSCVMSLEAEYKALYNKYINRILDKVFCSVFPHTLVYFSIAEYIFESDFKGGPNLSRGSFQPQVFWVYDFLAQWIMFEFSLCSCKQRWASMCGISMYLCSQWRDSRCSCFLSLSI